MPAPMNRSGGGKGPTGVSSSASEALAPRLDLSKGLNGGCAILPTSTPLQNTSEPLSECLCNQNGYSVADLSHALTPRARENILIREGLQTGTLTHSEVTHAAIRKS